MKISTVMLLVTLVLLVTAMFASNVLLKKEYDKLDKSDLYWTYGKILQQPFKHLKIEGGNQTNIAFEQSAKSSVRVFKNWEGYENGVVKPFVKNDTLFIKFPPTLHQGENNWLKYMTPVRIFSPGLLSITGYNTNLQLFKLKQKSININLSGKSKLEVESYLPDMDTLTILQRDSSEIVFEISPDLMTEEPNKGKIAALEKGPMIVVANNDDAVDRMVPALIKKGWETINVKFVEASVKDNSLLDIGHAQVGSFKLDIADSSGIILSGSSLRKLTRKGF